uniref:Uncharacterized protein n=1 Tax=Nothobranchius furzeri TaxID=105023 RepID=A0A8C6PQ49_NOTFU
IIIYPPIRAHTHTCVYAHARTYIHTHTYTHMRSHTHTRAHSLKRRIRNAEYQQGDRLRQNVIHLEDLLLADWLARQRCATLWIFSYLFCKSTSFHFSTSPTSTSISASVKLRFLDLP